MNLFKEQYLHIWTFYNFGHFTSPMALNILYKIDLCNKDILYNTYNLTWRQIWIQVH